MSAVLNPYLSFRDNAREAMTFYQEVFGGELVLSTFGEYGDKDAPEANLIMHANLSAPDGLAIMGADTPPGMDYTPPAGITISLSGDDDKLRTWFDRLAEGGEVTMPLEKQMWGDEFGMVTDRFGTPWMVNVAAPQA
jgi:PhnB protein